MEDKTIAYILAAIAGAFFGYLWGKRRQKHNQNQTQKKNPHPPKE